VGRGYTRAHHAGLDTADPGALAKLVTIAKRACIVHNTLTPALPITVRLT
jgi:hypothetical protein